MVGGEIYARLRQQVRQRSSSLILQCAVCLGSHCTALLTSLGQHVYLWKSFEHREKEGGLGYPSQEGSLTRVMMLETIF